MKKIQAQSATEMSILISAVLVGFLGMQIYFQRAAKGNLKVRSDSIGNQFSVEGSYSTNNVFVSARNSSTRTGLTLADGTKVFSQSRILNQSQTNSFKSKLGAQAQADAKRLNFYQGGAYSETETSEEANF